MGHNFVRMKSPKHTLSLLMLSFFVSFSTWAQVPKVYCTFWTGSQEILASLNFENQRLDTIGVIPGAVMFPAAAANGYDAYRNRYYVLSNQGLQALDASNGAQVGLAANFAAEPYKHLAYNPVTDQIYLTRYNGTIEEYYLISPEDYSIQSQGVLPFNAFALGCYGLDPVANQVLFHGQNTSGITSISTIRMATGEIDATFSRPSYIPSPLMPAYDPITERYFGVGTISAGKTALLEFRKSDYQIDTIGTIAGVSAIGVAGSAIDMVNRRFIFYSNLAVTSVSLTDPENVQTIPLPPGVVNVKGFQTNMFAAPPVLPRPNGQLSSIFKYVTGWYHNGNLIPNTANLQTYTPTEAGQYHYRITRPNGDWADSNPFTVTSVGKNQVKTSLRLYPNPASQVFFVEETEAGQSFRLLDMQGKMLQAGTLQAGSNRIEIKGLSPGIYQFQAGTRSQRLIVE